MSNKICNALTKVVDETRLSGDFKDCMICAITGEACIGKKVIINEKESSRFFSRGNAIIDMEKIKTCPSYGLSVQEAITAAKRRHESKWEELVKEISN